MSSLVLPRAPVREVDRTGTRFGWRDAAVTLAAVLVLGGPAIFTHDGFAPDFTNHLWLVWVQEQAISHHLAPTYFLNATPVGIFFPFFMFYGGTLYAVAGGLAALLAGHVTAAYVLVMLLAVAAAYGGLVWLARQLGVRSWAAHAPAVTYVASAYYVTNLYGRGAWPEAVGTSMIPLIFAAGWSLARSPRIGFGPAALFVAATAMFFGAHNITVLFGTLVMLGLIIALWIALGREFAVIGGLRRVAAIVGLLAVGVGLDAWFLLPDVLHASDTQIGLATGAPAAVTGYFDRAHVLFDPLRSVPHFSGTPALYVQAPDWFLAWVIGAAAVLWASLRSSLRRAGAALLVALLIILAVLMIDPLWNAMPSMIRSAQFPYRLNTYLVLCAAGVVLVGVMALEGAASRVRRLGLQGALAAATAVSVALCVWQLWVPSTHITASPIASYDNRDSVFNSIHVTPRTWYALSDYADASEPVVPASHGVLTIPPAAINSDHVRLTVTPPAGRLPFFTDISGGPYAVSVGDGLARAGRTPTGQVAARRVDSVRGPVTVAVATAGGVVTLGQIISLLALALVVIALVGYSLRRLRTSRG